MHKNSNILFAFDTTQNILNSYLSFGSIRSLIELKDVPPIPLKQCSELSLVFLQKNFSQKHRISVFDF